MATGSFLTRHEPRTAPQNDWPPVSRGLEVSAAVQLCDGWNLHRRPALYYWTAMCGSVRYAVGDCTCFRPTGAAAALQE
jgi:hypothetical protein